MFRQHAGPIYYLSHNYNYTMLALKITLHLRQRINNGGDDNDDGKDDEAIDRRSGNDDAEEDEDVDSFCMMMLVMRTVRMLMIGL